MKKIQYDGIWQNIPPLLTVKEVAGLLRVHVNTIYNWIRGGKLYAFKVGRDWRIPKEAIYYDA